MRLSDELGSTDSVPICCGEEGAKHKREAVNLLCSLLSYSPIAIILMSFV